MPALLVKLNGVPEFEAEGMRSVLREAGVPFYETAAGFFGFSLAAIWLADEDLDREEEALALLDDFQREHQRTAREAWQPRSVWQALRERPLRLVLLLAAGVILYFSISPFVRLALG